VGGSIASSAHGVARASIDADVVAELRPLSSEAAGERVLPLASAEDTVLAKLEWFRRGGEGSERQWTDVLGVLQASGASLDRQYMEEGARELGVSDLLAQALAEAGDR
jgi:hypothetical protein